MIGRSTTVWAATKIAALVLTGMVACSAAQAQISGVPSITCSWGKGSTFADVLRSIAAQAHVTIVAEGKPLQNALDSGFADAFPSGTGSADAVVKEVAARFDYHAERKGNVFYLTKRYTKPEDFPSVTLEECHQFLSDVVRAGMRLSPRIPLPTIAGDPLVDPIVDSLSPEQKTQMKLGLPVSSLILTQRELVQKFEMHFYLEDSLNSLTSGLKPFEGSRQAEAELVAGTLYGPSKPSLVYRYRSSGYIAETPLLRGDAAVSTEATPKVSSDTAERIGDLVSRLNTSEPTGGKPSVVDPSLADKTATIAGESYSAPEETLTGLARIYGLRVYEDTDAQTGKKQRRLARPRATQITQPSEIAPKVLNLMPTPIGKIIHDDNPLGMKADLRYSHVPPFVWNMERAQRVHNAAAWALMQRLTLMPAFQHDKHIALSDTDTETKNLLALILILDIWQPLWDLTRQETPQYISNPDGVYLQGGDVLDKTTGERQGFRLSLTYRTAGGKLQDEAGVYRNYPKNPLP